jgi:hypothetical protein
MRPHHEDMFFQYWDWKKLATWGEELAAAAAHP